VKIPRHGEDPRGEIRVRSQPRCVRDQSQPGFLGQVFGDVTVPGQAREKAEEPGMECLVDGLERCRVSATEALDKA